MTIKEFVNAAIKGGHPDWKVSVQSKEYPMVEKNLYALVFNMMQLEPEAWKAVGIVKKWGSFYDKKGMPRTYETSGWLPNTHENKISGQDGKMYQAKMIMMVNAMIEGKTLEEYIATL